MAGRLVGTIRRRWMAFGVAGLAVAVVIAAIVVGNSSGRPQAATPTGTDPGHSGTTAGEVGTAGPGSPAPGGGFEVLPAGFSVRAGAAPSQTPATTPVVVGEPLEASVIEQILGRLPAWSGTSELATPFHWPAQSLTKPAAGQTITQQFPAGTDSQDPPTTPAQIPSGPLTVLRMQPQGSVPVAPFVSITFSQPMIAVGTVGQLRDEAVPASITPTVPGHWDWLGTTTLRFSADSATVDRLPMATTFTVTVPAGTKSHAGGVLAEPASATFSTPPPTVQTFTPGSKEPVGLHPVMVAVFNQIVDPAAVLESLSVTVGDAPWPVRVATAAEIAADKSATETLSVAPKGRTVAFVPVQDFPAATQVGVTVKAGTRSAEGPLTSGQDADFHFSTYPAMSLLRGSCTEWGCQPGGPIVLAFSNPIDTDAFDPATVTVDPAVPGGASIVAVGDQITVSGATQPATVYRISVKAGLTDIFGQQLAKDADTTVTIGHADTQIYPFPTPVSTLDPMVSVVSGPTVTITTVNQKRFRERVFAVDLSDWAAYRGWYAALQQSGDYQPGADLHAPGWQVLVDRTVPVSGAGDQLIATTLDLSGQLTGGRRQAVVLIEPIDPLTQQQVWQNRPTLTWVQQTTLGVDAITDRTGMRAWVTDLRTGTPVAGVSVVRLDGTGQQMGDPVSTDGEGLASIDLGSSAAAALLATKGDQRALLPADMWGSSWERQPQQDRLLWYVTDDRQTYRPGETVSVKGWVRRQAGTTEMSLTTPATGTVSWSATDGDGTQIGTGSVTVDRMGGFDLALQIPAGAHLGTADLRLDLGGTAGIDDTGTDHWFTIADYRTPAFDVDTHASTGDSAVRGDDLSVQADASYYAGGPVGNAAVAWQVRTAKASYSPPGWADFTFGVWTPWWYEAGYDAGYGGGFRAGGGAPCCGYGPPGDNPGGPGSTVQTFAGTTDGNGSDYLAVTVGNLGKDTDGLPVTVVAQATVTDVDRQQIAGTAHVLVHPALDYVGLASDGTFIKQGQKLTVRAIATGIDGTAEAGRPITVTAARVAGGWAAGPAGGQQQQTLVDPQTCSITSKATPGICTFTPTVGGQYQITATVTDEQGRTSRTELTRWVAGPDGSIATTVQEQSLTLVPDRKEYQPGESATLLVASPIITGTGLITLSHNGIVSSSTFAVAEGSAVVTVPISQGSVPGVAAYVEVVGTVPRTGDAGAATGSSTAARPAYATGQINLAVSTLSRSLTVTAKPRQSAVKPGGQTTIDVTVTDRAGKPVPDSQFAVMVVDEAVLALGDYQLPNPLDAFYPAGQQGWLQTVYGRSTVMLGAEQAAHGAAVDGTAAATSAAASGSTSYDSQAVPAAAAAPERGVASSGSGTAGKLPTTPIDQRSAFAALALFRPTVTTGADGTAEVPVTVPDNLTRYRVMVVAVAGDTQFGTGESTITAGLPLTVRPQPPRFLNFGDRAELPVLVQNLTDAPLSTDVVLQAGNLTVAAAGTGTTAGATGKKVTVPANGRIEVRFDVAADQAGTARFRVAAVSGDDADAAQQDFPVYTPSTSETFATYGSIQGGTVIRQQVTKPSDVIPAFGGLQISTSSTALAQLTDAVGYVADYDFATSDALACRVIAISSLGDVLQAFSTPALPSPAELKALAGTDIGKLVALQNTDGGFPYWKQGEESSPFNSIQVVQALLTAEKFGYAGSAVAAVKQAVDKALPYLRDIDARLDVGTSAQTRDTINAYALAVRALAGDGAASAAADRMVTARGAALPMDAVAWLLPIVSPGPRQDLLARVTNAAVDNAGSVTFTESVADDAWTVLHSDARTDALILDALLTVDPTSDLIVKVVNSLMAQQRGGRWDNVQGNAFALVAVRHYYDTYEATTPDFVAAAWLGDTFAGEHSYSGHTTEQAVLDIPTMQVIKQGDTSITVADTGSGRMYYRIGLTTAPTSLTVPALDRGFVVSRSYAGADDPSDVTRGADGIWHVKAGARVRVTVTMVSRSAQSHVALTDPLPAGLEALNPALATTSKDLAGKNAAGGDADPLSWAPTWYDHQDLRDDRAEAFAGWLQGGVYTYNYLASATTPGTFVVPAATAEQIYAPETFGRSATDRVVVAG